MRRPNSYAADLRQQRYDLFIAESVELTEIDTAASDVFGEIGERGNFLARETAGAQLFGREFQKSRRGKTPAHRFPYPVENRRCGFPVKLLERDRTSQRLECGLAVCQAAGADALDNLSENGIACAQMKDGGFHRLAPDDNHNQMSRFVRYFAALLTVAACAAAQDQPIRVDVDLVNILFTVKAKKGGALIPNLEKNNFTIREDGKPQTIQRFSRETDLPLTLGLLIDISASQERLIDIERQAASPFFPA